MLRTIAHYSSSHTYRRLLNVFFAFLKPKLLSPELYGLWNLLSIIPQYAVYSDLGVSASVRYLVPRHVARGERRERDSIANTAFYGTLITKLVIIAGLLAFIAIADLERIEKAGMLTMAIIVILSWHYEFHMSLLKAHQNFSLLTLTNYLLSSVRVIGGIILLLLFNLYGLYANIILSYLFVVVFLKGRNIFTPSLPPDFREYVGLVKYGFPIMVLSLSVVLISTTDRILISYFLGNAQLGYYGIAVMVFAFLMDIPAVTREVIVPRLMQSMASRPWEDNLDEYLLQPLVNTAFFLPFLLGPVFFIFPFVIELVLPRYSAGVVPAQIICLGGYFLALSYPARAFIVANHWQFQALIVMVPAFIVNVACSVILIMLGLGIKGVAVGSSVSYMVLAHGLLAFIAVRARSGKKKCVSYALATWWPIAGLCLVVPALKYAFAATEWNIFFEGLVSLAVFYAVFLAVLAFCRRTYPLLQGERLSLRLRSVFGRSRNAP